MTPFESTPHVGISHTGKYWRLVGLILFATTLVIFSPTLNNGFVNRDDNEYVTEQPGVLNGISPRGLIWAMTANVCGNWHPLTLVSLQLDAQLFGREPLGFHRTAIVLHAINALLAFHALVLLTGSPLRSAIVASIFALHPLRVESVAWISERKDLLSGFFFFLTLIAYVRYCQSQSMGRYLLVVLALGLGLCSKSMLVTTPCLLLLLDYWPLKRFTSFSANELPQIRNLLIEKVPLFGLSGVTAWFTIIYQKKAMSNLERLPIGIRLENAARGCVAYLGQSFWPSGLSAIYPIPESSILAASVAMIILLVLTGVAIWQRKRRPYLVVGWCWYLGMLVPVSGLVQVGMQQRADRYTFLPHVGLFLAVTWGIFDLVKSLRRGTLIAECFLFAFVAGLSCITVGQIPIWHDSKSLWSQAYTATSRNREAICNLIPELLLAGDREQARRLADEAIAIEDRYHLEGLVNLGNVLSSFGEFEASVRAFDQALKVRPDAQLFASRGGALAAQEEWDKAVDSFRQATQLAPNATIFEFCLAHALTKSGRSDEADRVRAVALRKSPRWAELAAAMAWETSTKVESNQEYLFFAVCLAEEANTVTGGNQAHFLDVLATAYAGYGRFDMAASTATRAMERAVFERQLEYANKIRSRLERFKNRERYREK